MVVFSLDIFCGAGWVVNGWGDGSYVFYLGVVETFKQEFFNLGMLIAIGGCALQFIILNRAASRWFGKAGQHKLDSHSPHGNQLLRIGADGGGGILGVLEHQWREFDFGDIRDRGRAF